MLTVECAMSSYIYHYPDMPVEYVTRDNGYEGWLVVVGRWKSWLLL